MKLHFFKRNTLSDTNPASVETRIEGLIENFKKNPKSWDEKTMGPAAEIRNSVLNRILGSMESEKKRKLIIRKNISIAASVMLVMGALWLGLNQYGFWKGSEEVIVKTDAHHLKNIVLSDGSIVWLNVNSTLSYPEDFHGDKREVSLLEGEAFFDVKHDAKKPFQVKAGKTLTNVLGTAFNINAYSWLETINVTVSKGKVAVNNEMLLPDQQAEYHKESGEISQKKLMASNVISWMVGKLAFNDQDFKTVASILEKKFNVSIGFAHKSLEGMHFTAQFEQTETLDDILTALTLTTGLNYTTKGNTIVITN
ncbi:FecR family protein [Pedobacter frigoris]|uniref:DUF4974 domain-containing protein n=1 Tax=Pedobacter frigoris TaxID=2571272 RepID=A0A4U1CMZ3_9SPHI|nr:FecR domain-containing protein [Pedobacter frigoris]TKC08596.1 DUF4974 domain-containing protein [Pedobacter frigoris]